MPTRYTTPHVRLLPLLVLPVALVLAACTESPSSFEPEAPTYSKGGAVSWTVIQSISEEYVLESGAAECVVEDIHIQATLHYTTHLTEGPSGNLLYRFTVNDQNASGTGSTTGTRYRRVGATTYTVNDGGPLPIVLHATDSFHFIGQGQAPNLLIRRVVHYTIDANGRLTAFVPDEFQIVCR